MHELWIWKWPVHGDRNWSDNRARGGDLDDGTWILKVFSYMFDGFGVENKKIHNEIYIELNDLKLFQTISSSLIAIDVLTRQLPKLVTTFKHLSRWKSK